MKYIAKVIYNVKSKMFDNGNKFHILGNGNQVLYHGATFSDVTCQVTGDNNKIIIGPGSEIRNVWFFINGSNHVLTIGKDCFINRGGLLWFEDDHCELAIGDQTTIEEAHIALTEPGSRITIGKDCMFANDIDIRCGDSHSIIDISTGERINYAEDVIVEDHVWVGAHVQILKGSQIGFDSVIGSGSVVSKIVPAHSVAAGVPAKVIRTNIHWERERLPRGDG
jgi:acetyltransferase-like isoleucine patch superfamily enzyme